MRLTTKGRYGVRALINLAVADTEEPVSIKIIAHKEGISPEFLEQIFYLLKKDGIISSVRGPGGGFVLKKDLDKISIKDVLNAVGENVSPTPCTNHEEGCDRKNSCMVSATWENFYKIMNEFLEGVSLKDIIKN